MSEERINVGPEEQKRAMALTRLLAGEWTEGETALVVGLSTRHVRRLKRAYREEGIAGLIHGNRGRAPWNRVDEEVRSRVRELAQTRYVGVNDHHLSELLAEPEREGICLSRSSVRRFLREAGIPSPRKRRAPKHRSRRERAPQEGMLLQIDGSRHDWLEGRGPYLSLVGAIDDATGKVPYVLFRDQEDAQGYFLLLEHIVQQEGIPLAVYRDRHGIFERSKGEKATIEEQFAGQLEPTQFGRLLEELSIESIPALSPQAKGRVERLWGTFQDRLVSELRLAGASTIPEANQVLWSFLPRFNERFAVPVVLEGTAYRRLPTRMAPEELFCFKYQRTVAGDNTVQFAGRRLQLLPGGNRISYARCRVQVHERMDGSLGVYYQGEQLACQSAPMEAPVLRVRNSKRPPVQEPLEAIHRRALQARHMAPLFEQGRPTRQHPWKTHFPDTGGQNR